MRRRVVILLGLAAAAGVAALALGGRSGQPLAPEAALARAGARTLDTGSFRFTFRLTQPRNVVETGDGAVDYRDSRGELTMSGAGFTVRAISDGGAVYYSWPSSIDGAKPWLRVDGAGDARELLGMTDSPVPVAEPAALLGFLQRAGDAQEVGSEVVRGVETTRYRGRVDLQRVGDQVGEEELRFRREEGLPTTLELEAWIDRDGLARRVRVDDALVVEYFDFGADVVVQPPPSDEVMSVDGEGIWPAAARPQSARLRRAGQTTLLLRPAPRQRRGALDRASGDGTKRLK